MKKLFVALPLFLSACNPAYVVRAAYEESKILLARRPIDEVIKDPSTPASDRDKLALVLKARSYGNTLGLNPKDSFTKFTKVDREVLAWVLLASKVDAFEPYTWWYPVVGSIPYKGYFEQADATAEAERLNARGYESWIRGTEAFSTLGWFNDPVLSTTLKNDEVQIVNTVLHESLHSTIWVQGQVDFNESMANFVGHQGAINFFEYALPACADDACRDRMSKFLAQAKKSLENEIKLAAVIERISTALDTIYKSSRSREDKLKERERVFDEQVRDLWPSRKILLKINNAEIMQLRLYLTGFDKFQKLFEKHGQDWKSFLIQLKGIADGTDSEHKPFDLLSRQL